MRHRPEFPSGSYVMPTGRYGSIAAIQDPQFAKQLDADIWRLVSRLTSSSANLA